MFDKVHVGHDKHTRKILKILSFALKKVTKFIENIPKNHQNTLQCFNEYIGKRKKPSPVIVPRNPVSKNQLRSSKIVGCSPRTDRHTHRQRKQNLETPIFCNLFLFFWVEI